MLLLGHRSASRKNDKAMFALDHSALSLTFCLETYSAPGTLLAGFSRNEVQKLYALQQPKLGGRVSDGLTQN